MTDLDFMHRTVRDWAARKRHEANVRTIWTVVVVLVVYGATLLVAPVVRPGLVLVVTRDAPR